MYRVMMYLAFGILFAYPANAQVDSRFVTEAGFGVVAFSSGRLPTARSSESAQEQQALISLWVARRGKIEPAAALQVEYGNFEVDDQVIDMLTSYFGAEVRYSIQREGEDPFVLRPWIGASWVHLYPLTGFYGGRDKWAVPVQNSVGLSAGWDTWFTRKSFIGLRTGVMWRDAEIHRINLLGNSEAVYDWSATGVMFHVTIR